MTKTKLQTRLSTQKTLALFAIVLGVGMLAVNPAVVGYAWGAAGAATCSGAGCSMAFSTAGAVQGATWGAGVGAAVGGPAGIATGIAIGL